MEEPKVGFVVGCVDCRHHVPEAEMIAQLQGLLRLDDVYLRTTAGPDGKMLKKDHNYLSIVEDAQTIKSAKGATVFAVMGHYGCAGHNVSDEQHQDHTRRAAEALAREIQHNVYALLFVPNDESMQPTWKITSLGSCSPHD